MATTGEVPSNRGAVDNTYGRCQHKESRQRTTETGDKVWRNHGDKQRCRNKPICAEPEPRAKSQRVKKR